MLEGMETVGTPDEIRVPREDERPAPVPAPQPEREKEPAPA
jgi:hypothetical protein